MGKEQNWLMAGAAIAVIAASLIYVTGGPKSVVGGGAAAAQVTAAGGTCPTTGVTDLQFKAQYTDLSTNQDTNVNTTVVVYKKGETTSIVSATTGTGGYTSVASPKCGSELTAFIGDGGTNYYYQKVDVPAASTTGGNVQLSSNLKKSAAGTLTFSNSTAFGQTSVYLFGVGAGATTSDVTMKFKAGQYYFGDGATEFCALWTMSNVTKVSFGAGATEIPVDPSIAVTTGQQIKCYEVAGDLYNYAAKELPVVIQVKAGVTAVNTSIDIYANDKSAYIKNGELITGYFNADTNANIGRSAISQVGAVVVNYVP